MATRGKPRVSAKDAERTKLEELQSLIVNPDDVGEPLANPEFPDRRLLHKGVLDRILPTGEVEDGVVILLSDLLIYCLEDAHGMLTVDGVIEISEEASVKISNQPGANGTLFVLNVLSGEGYGYTFVAQDEHEQDFWFDLITSAIDPEYVRRTAPGDKRRANQYQQRDEEYDDAESEYSSRPQSRQSVRTYEQDLSVHSHDSGDADSRYDNGESRGDEGSRYDGESRDDGESRGDGDYDEPDLVEEDEEDHFDDDAESGGSYSRPQSRASSRPESRRSSVSESRRSSVSNGALPSKLADSANLLSRSMSRFSDADYKSPDSFLSQRFVSTLHPQDSANEEVLMGQVASLPNLQQVQQIAEALAKRTIEQRLLMMSKPEGCIMIKFNVSNGNPVARKVRLSADRESIEWCKADSFIENWSSRLWIKDIAALRFAPTLDTKVYKHGSVADYLTFACILRTSSSLYKKAPRRYQVKAENAKIGIADVPIELNPVMEVPALVLSARRGIDVLDWYLGLQHLIQMKGMSDTDVSGEEIILRIASEDPSAIIHQRETHVYLKQKILEKMREHRKKEIIVERYEAKLKQEQEQLAYEVQRANEARQRNQGQREKQSSNTRGGKHLPSSSRNGASASRRAAADDNAPPPTRGNAVPGRQRRQQNFDQESDDGYSARGAARGSSGRGRSNIDVDEDAASDYSRQNTGRPAPRSRGVMARDEPEDLHEEYAAAPVGRRGHAPAPAAFQRDEDYEPQPAARRRGAAALPPASSSSSARPRRAQA